MGAVNGPALTTASLTLTGHPFQRAGAWAVVVLAGRPTVDEVSAADLDQVAERIVEEVCAAATAAKGSAAYDWWKALFALYPNSKATHSKRPQDRVVLKAAVEELFVVDAEGGGVAVRSCTFCRGGASVVWAKSNLPLFDTNKALNTLPPGVPGWPVCRGCRIAVWALPYGSWVTAGSATVLTCERDAAEREFAEGNVRRARRVMQLGFDRVLGAGVRPELVALRALRAVRAELSGTTLWSFKNDNQEPWLRVTRTRRAVPCFLAVVEGNAPLRRAWRLLELWLTRRDKQGAVVSSGSAEAARLLFEAEDGRSVSFLYKLCQLLNDKGRPRYAQDEADLMGLALTYTKEILGMEPDLVPVATLLADWIEHGSGSPRGRWAEYYNVSQNGYRLGLLLNKAQNRLMLDGRDVPATANDWRPLIGQRSGHWEHRMLLTPTVSKILADRGVRLNERVSEDEERRVREAVESPILSYEDDEVNGPS
ncbi:hypothetical protein NX801_26810 [Streptomyces sp. LP05-1]|uniref:Uncharacterized protein n=1 Tax=Streptomyces pyxinae TaxID=2970734 RepID=A0ABT2CP19_9ACTN|nr:hypothetical protein [Streptomyces sp. LP05-1]MCS0639188.1 hypothetical protein [Streptomyces sp. LP05-1]